MKKYIAVVGIVIAVGLSFWSLRKVRPKYIFLNETENHTHDSAYKLSLKIAEKRAGIENALILLKQLPANTTIEQEANRLFHKYDIGRSRSGKGLLLLYSEKENLFKIEVSYALEGALPDALCHHLEQAAQTYMLSEVPFKFLTELIITLNLHGAERILPSDYEFSWSQTAPHLSGGAGVRSKGYSKTLADLEEAIGRAPAAESVQFAASQNPEEVVSRYLRSLEMGLGDPDLPLLTEGSKMFRMIVPRNRAQQNRTHGYYLKGMPFELKTDETLGFAVFRPGPPNLPIVLRHGGDGFWYVDEPKAWTYFHRWESDDASFPKYHDLPIIQSFDPSRFPTTRKPIYDRRTVTPYVPRYTPGSITDKIRKLEAAILQQPNEGDLYRQMGDVYLFDINWASKAIEAFEKAAQLQPLSFLYRWRLFDLYLNHCEPEKMVRELAYIQGKSPGDAQVKEWYEFYKKEYSFEPGEFD